MFFNLRPAEMEPVTLLPMPSASVTLRPGLQRNSTEPAPELETMLMLLANEET
ncbi:hypothetical protein D3C73_1332920 [compost metagenome]